jgi:hypothetical protein
MNVYCRCGTCGKMKRKERFGGESNAKCDTCKEARIKADVARVARQKAIEFPDYSKLNSLWITT